MLGLHCQEAAIQSPAPSLIPVLGNLECVSHPQSPLLCALLTHTGVGRDRRSEDVLALAQSRVTWMCTARAKSRKSFLRGLFYCSFCAQKHARAGTRLVRGGREVWQGWMLHQVSPAAPSLNLTSWGSRQWLLVPFPKTSGSWNGMFPPQPTQNCKPGSPGSLHPCPAGT